MLRPSSKIKLPYRTLTVVAALFLARPVMANDGPNSTMVTTSAIEHTPETTDVYASDEVLEAYVGMTTTRRWIAVGAGVCAAGLLGGAIYLPTAGHSLDLVAGLAVVALTEVAGFTVMVPPSMSLTRGLNEAGASVPTFGRTVLMWSTTGGFVGGTGVAMLGAIVGADVFDVALGIAALGFGIGGIGASIQTISTLRAVQTIHRSHPEEELRIFPRLRSDSDETLQTSD